MTKNLTLLLTAIIAVVVVLGGIGVYLLATQSEDTGKIVVYVKDLPDGWTHVNVTFSEVRIHQADAGNDSGWLNLTLQEQTIDLASYVNVSALLASGDVAAGNYTQIRIVVSAVTGTMSDGSMVNFTVPSGELKINHPFNITAGQTEKLTVDIDLGHSIVQSGSGWIFKPVLGSIVEG